MSPRDVIWARYLSKLETFYCDDCGTEIIFLDDHIFVSELPVDIASASEGESACLCRVCATRLGIDNS